jgi:hypothetical protein
MKAIKITKENSAAIEAALLFANGKSLAHTYNYAQDILDMAESGEKFLDLLMFSKTEKAGAVRRETSGGAVSNSYKSLRNATCVVINRKGAGWYLTEIHAVRIFTSGGGKPIYSLTKAQDEAAKRRLSALYTVIQE